MRDRIVELGTRERSAGIRIHRSSGYQNLAVGKCEDDLTVASRVHAPRFAVTLHVEGIRGAEGVSSRCRKRVIPLPVIHTQIRETGKSAGIRGRGKRSGERSGWTSLVC